MNQRQQFEQKLIERAMKDESFRMQLLENPGAAIEEETGMKIPETVKIKVLEEDPQTVYLILPQVTIKNAELELDEAELESVSGGTGGTGGGDGPGWGWTKVSECGGC